MISQETTRIDRLLETLTSVLKARVRGSAAEDRLTEIHILSDASVPPKQIVRNIETLLKTAFDLSIDHRIVSIAELKPDAPLANNGNKGERIAETVEPPVTRYEVPSPPPPASASAAQEPQRVDRNTAAPTSPRVVFHSLRIMNEGSLKVTAHVELRMGDAIFEGRFSETDTPRARVFASARAVIEALEYMAERETAFHLAGIETLRVSGRDVLIVLVEGRRERDRRRMFGAATIADDPQEAAVRAVLDAVNRFITRAPTDATG